MKKFLIAGTSLAAVAAAGSAGAVDVTLGGSIDMGMSYGVGKDSSGFKAGDAFASVSLNVKAAGTTDGGLKYGGSFSLKTADEVALDLYLDDTDKDGKHDAGEKKNLLKLTAAGKYENVIGAVYNVSGGKQITEDNIVGVKINSDWVSAGGKNSKFALEASVGVSNNQICKLAGRGVGGFEDSLDAGQSTSKGAAFEHSVDIPAAAALAGPTAGEYAYLPAGRLLGVANSATLLMSMDNEAAVQIAAIEGNDANHDLFDIELGDTDANEAKVFVGPFAEVKLTSSTTKMVVGAVCVTGNGSLSETKAYLDVSTAVVQASGAKIFIDGGFGRLDIQTGDYAGKVSAIGKAGDAANLTSGGLVAIASGNFMGLDAGLAVTNGFTGLDNIAGKWLAFGSAAFGGLSIDMDVNTTATSTAVYNKDTNSDGKIDTADTIQTSNVYTTNWDMGLGYALGDIALNAALDSGGDFGIKGATSVAGLDLGAEIYNVAKKAHTKSGMNYKVTAGASLNGAKFSIAYDQDGDISGTMSYDVGGINVYANYDQGDKGGKVGAKLTF